MIHAFIALAAMVILFCASAANAQLSADFSGGSVVLGYDSRTCDGSIEGAMRFASDGPANGLVSYWAFEETSGTTYADSIGSNNGTYSEVSVVPASGVNSNAADFAAVNDYINAGSDASLDITTGTVSLWFNTPNANIANNRYFVAKDNAANNSGDFGLLIKNSTDGTNPSKIEFIIYSTSNNSVFSDSAVTANEWTHLAVTFGSGGMEMFVNGVKQVDTHVNTTGMSNTTADFFIGNLRAGNTLDFDGLIDEVRVYNRVLTEAEIAAMASRSIQVCKPAGNSCPNIGDTCSDGSVYAGLSPDGNVPMYTTPADAPSTHAWNNGNGVGWVDTTIVNCIDVTPGTATSCQTGASNTAILILEDSNINIGGVQPHQAAAYCDGVSAHGHSDWYLPAQDELDVLYDNKNVGSLNGTFNESGSFPAGYYWSSSEFNSQNARRQIFSDGSQLHHGKNVTFSVRCVRKSSTPPVTYSWTNWGE